jgi:hypothetical protein
VYQFLNERMYIAYIKTLGARILSEANDLKRTSPLLCADVGITYAMLRAVYAGTVELALVQDIIDKMLRVYPCNLNQLWVDADDTVAGVRIMRQSASAASARVMKRVDRTSYSFFFCFVSCIVFAIYTHWWLLPMITHTYLNRHGQVHALL